jgi:hypothetical protein
MQSTKRSEQMPDDAFFGHWEMDPAENRYEMGQPPVTASYHIEPFGEAYRFTLAWTDAEGNPYEMMYMTAPDGIAHPYENPAQADTIKTTRADARTLDTEITKNGVVLATGRRVLSMDGHAMTIAQSGTRPDGTAFTNLSVYRR